MVMLQEQAEKLMKTFIVQAPGMNDEGKKVLDQWMGVYKKAGRTSKRPWMRGIQGG
jgi:hypothetical protein